MTSQMDMKKLALLPLSPNCSNLQCCHFCTRNSALWVRSPQLPHERAPVPSLSQNLAQVSLGHTPGPSCRRGSKSHFLESQLV